MITVTEAAGQHLAQLLDREDIAADVAVRLVVDQQGIAMKADTASEGDTTIEHGGRTVLVLDSQIAELLENHTLDVEPSDEGTRLTLRGEQQP